MKLVVAVGRVESERATVHIMYLTGDKRWAPQASPEGPSIDHDELRKLRIEEREDVL